MTKTTLDPEFPIACLLLLTYGDSLFPEEIDSLIDNIELKQLNILSQLLEST
jgi:hypothetical protein